jgi:hypothetical protein
MTNERCSCPDCKGNCKKPLATVATCLRCGRRLPFTSSPCLNCTYYDKSFTYTWKPGDPVATFEDTDGE